MPLLTNVESIQKWNSFTKSSNIIWVMICLVFTTSDLRSHPCISPNGCCLPHSLVQSPSWAEVTDLKHKRYGMFSQGAIHKFMCWHNRWEGYLIHRTQYYVSSSTVIRKSIMLLLHSKISFFILPRDSTSNYWTIAFHFKEYSIVSNEGSSNLQQCPLNPAWVSYTTSRSALLGAWPCLVGNGL